MKMYKPFALIVSALILAACHSEPGIEPNNCSYDAVVEDHTGLDGCGFLFRLKNGEYLYPVWPYFCGTPPQAVENPLEDFEYVNGKRVRIEFEYLEGFANVCMKGSTVIINSVEDVQCDQEE
ncbi:hypothetical protein GCM10009122_53250 [Fulvivirga kasyanovii]|uniref:Lipoprotein n=1 Tax=Fulvivirga kasyanovii TaxID=396812 RepID=A0ABW9RJJ2_9BACT|nr:hypothetical protein [Fulvivirga kasyanovii]MTI24100.1 hypothetical protein [Fulvivirga kasyanovii]